MINGTECFVVEKYGKNKGIERVLSLAWIALKLLSGNKVPQKNKQQEKTT